MKTREEQIEPWGFISPFAKNSLQDREMCNLTITRKSTVSATMALYTKEQLREAERRAEQRVRAEMSAGYIFHNPDTGTEILPYHPVESGECCDAKDIRQATAEVLKEELLSTWEEMANEYRERAERGEESRKDSERLDWLLSHSHYSIPGFDPVVPGRTPLERKADLIRAIDAALKVEKP